MQVRSLGWEDPLEKGMATPPVFLPGESYGQGILVGYGPWGLKESDTTEPLHFTSSPTVSFVHEIFQARILEWVAFPSPGDLSDRDRTHLSWISCINRQILYH